MNCQCEHVSHFEARTAHPYGEAGATVCVPTDFGPFLLCEGCRQAGHMQPAPVTEAERRRAEARFRFGGQNYDHASTPDGV